MKTEKLLNLTGEIMISEVEELRNKMLEIAKKEKDVSLDISGIEDMDVAALQLFYSFNKELRSKGGSFSFTGIVMEKVKQKLKLCGIISESVISDFEVLAELNKTLGGE